MIVVDTTALVYAVGEEHELAAPSRGLVEAIGDGRIQATTMAEAIREFVHLRSRHRGRPDAVRIGRAFVELLSPLLVVDRRVLERGLRLYERSGLGAFDAVLAAAAIESDVAALVSGDRAFASVPRLRFLELGSAALDELLAAG